jgi:hypothetical protein
MNWATEADKFRGCFKSPGRYNFTVLTWVKFNEKLRDMYTRCFAVLTMRAKDPFKTSSKSALNTKLKKR